MTLDATELRKLHELKPCPIEAQNLGFTCLGTTPPMPCCIAKAGEIPRSDLPIYNTYTDPETGYERTKDIRFIKDSIAATSASGTDEALVNLPVDSGINAESVERAEFLWANLPTMRKWTSLATHEKALVCHLLDRELSTSKAKLEAAEEMAEAPVWQFLLGEGPLFGCHFGENPVNERGNFWWRKHLRAELAIIYRELAASKAKLEAAKELAEALHNIAAVSVVGNGNDLKTIVRCYQQSLANWEQANG